MKYDRVPSGGNGTRAEIAECYAHGVLKWNVGAFIDSKDWEKQGGQTQPPVDGPRKTWRDNAALWGAQDSYDYLMLARNADGSYVHFPLTPGKPTNTGPDNVPATGGLTDVDQTQLKAFSQAAWLFIHQYAADFGYTIPMVKALTLSREEAVRFSPGGDGPNTDFPINIPSDVMLRFNPATGDPEWFFFQDYVREHPTPVVKPAASGLLTSAELIGAVTAILGDVSMKPDEKAAAIRMAAK